MSTFLSPSQKLANAIVPLVCFSIAFLIFVFLGPSIWVDFIEDEEYSILAYILMISIIGCFVLAAIFQFVKLLKEYIREKNAPPKPATPPAPPAQPASDLARAREIQRAQTHAGYQQPAATVTYSTSPAPVRVATPPPPQVVQTIIKEVVKVRCSFCGTLVDQGLRECPNCGGRM
nr:hypothetical protein [Candidatus Sigynarchaeum springense]